MTSISPSDCCGGRFLRTPQRQPGCDRGSVELGSLLLHHESFTCVSPPHCCSSCHWKCRVPSMESPRWRLGGDVGSKFTAAADHDHEEGRVEEEGEWILGEIDTRGVIDSAAGRDCPVPLSKLSTSGEGPVGEGHTGQGQGVPEQQHRPSTAVEPHPRGDPVGPRRRRRSSQSVHSETSSSSSSTSSSSLSSDNEGDDSSRVSGQRCPPGGACFYCRAAHAACVRSQFSAGSCERCKSRGPKCSWKVFFLSCCALPPFPPSKYLSGNIFHFAPLIPFTRPSL